MDKQDSPPLEVTQDPRPRPEQIPTGWIVFNSFRPVWGSAHGDVLHLWWRDVEGPDGIQKQYWAAVDPGDTMAPVYLDRNRDHKKAVIVQFADDITGDIAW